MKVLLQRVKSASAEIVEPDQRHISGEIGAGLLLFIGFGESDTLASCEKAVDKVLKLRIFADENGKMNESVFEQQKSILVVSQFTLYAETSQNRPGFSKAMNPTEAEKLYRQFVQLLEGSSKLSVATGVFGAKMEIALVNDGPVTMMLEF
jgi:D-tyrosyl-tRNA(Tyr) deacylase